jgi:hypothetical protein
MPEWHQAMASTDSQEEKGHPFYNKLCMCSSKCFDLPLFDVDGVNEKMIKSITKACL